MRSLRFNLLIGVATYAALLVLAIVFYKERTIFIDIAYHLFELIKNKTFAIQNNRFGAFVTQAFPLSAIALGLPLKSVLLAYSTGFVIYYFAVFLLCLLLFRSSEMALTMLLFSILMVSGTFYWIQSEFPQGLALLFLYFAALTWQHNHGRNNLMVNVALVLLVFTLAFFHPLLLIVYLFITLFFLLSRPTPAFKRALITNLLIFIGFAGIKAIFLKTVYDSQAMGGIKNFRLLFPDYFNLESNREFLKYLLHDYYLLAGFLAITLAFYFYKKQFLKLGLVASFFFGYLLLINVSYPQGADQFYIENLYLPLSIFLIIAFVYDVLPVLKPNYAAGLLVFLVLIRGGHIYLEHEAFSNRLNWMRNFMHQTAANPAQKLIVAEMPALKETLFMTWATPYEFWLLSTLETGKTRSIMIHEKPESVQWMLPGNKQFLTPWGGADYQDLSEKYFILQDSSAYQVLN